MDEDSGGAQDNEVCHTGKLTSASPCAGQFIRLFHAFTHLTLSTIPGDNCQPSLETQVQTDHGLAGLLASAGRAGGGGGGHQDLVSPRGSHSGLRKMKWGKKSCGGLGRDAIGCTSLVCREGIELFAHRLPRLPPGSWASAGFCQGSIRSLSSSSMHFLMVFKYGHERSQQSSALF